MVIVFIVPGVSTLGGYLMSKSADLTKQLRYQCWIEEVRACKARPAGMSVKRWCLENGIKEQTYYDHLHRIKEYAIDAVDEIVPETALSVADNGLLSTPAEKPQTFVELPLPKPVARNQHSVKLTLGKATMEIPEDISDGFLIRLFRAANHA